MQLSLSHPSEDGNISTCKIRATAPNGKVFELQGGNARTLAALSDAGVEGIAATECLNWTYRLAAHVYRLRRLGFPINGQREVLKRNWRIRYRLASEIFIEPLPS